MALDDADVRRIAHLARLDIRDEDLAGYARNLSDILSFVDQLDQADTGGVVPMAHPLEMAQRLRPDAVTEGDQRDKFQSVAPSVENGLFLVPRVIE